MPEITDIVRSMLLYHRTGETPPQSLFEALWNECQRRHGRYTTEANVAYETALWAIKAAT